MSSKARSAASIRPGRVLLLAAVGVLLCGAPAAAQGRGVGARGERGAMAGPMLLRDSLPGQDPISLLLEQTASLRLRGDQVSALTGLRTELRKQNAELLEKLLVIRAELRPLIGMHPREMNEAQRQQLARASQRARPLMLEVQQNNVRAMQRVGELLDESQKVALRQWLGQRPGMRTDSLPRGRGRMGPGRGMHGLE